MEILKAEDIKNIFELARDIMIKSEDYLFDLDSKMGDGDLGITMKTGFMAVAEGLSDFEESDIGKIFIKAGMIMASSVPSTMGTLIAGGLLGAGKAINGKKELRLEDVSEMFLSFVNGIAERGKARPGDRTVLDSLLPMAAALKDASEKRKSLKEAFKDAYVASKRGLESTREMIPKHGKAVYHIDRSKGEVDPGAAAAVLFIKAFYDYLINK